MGVTLWVAPKLLESIYNDNLRSSWHKELVLFSLKGQKASAPSKPPSLFH